MANIQIIFNKFGKLVFSIDGQTAYAEDFITQTNPAEPYAAKAVTNDILHKYGITTDEYHTITQKLIEGSAFWR